VTKGIPRPCLDCGEVIASGSRCDDCRRAHRRATDPPKANTKARGYGSRWQRLSKRARRMQPWCTDCGTTEDLTTDHTPEAWARFYAGRPIRLQDIDVVCRPCNARRGRARPVAPSPTGTTNGPQDESSRARHGGSPLPLPAPTRRGSPGARYSPRSLR